VNRSQRLRTVYVELKEVFGDQLSAGELLRLASAFIHAYQNADVERFGEFGYSTREPFGFYDVDRAMGDGGWRVLHYERKMGMELTDELPDNFWVIQGRVKRLVGQVQWPRIEME